MRWVCITNCFENFTYGKIYEGDVENNYILNVPNDNGDFNKPALFGSDIDGNIVKYFITHDEWEKQNKEKSDKIAKHFWETVKKYESRIR